MAYLPNESVSDTFWKGLVSRIHTKLKESCILFSWSESRLYRPGDLSALPITYRDQHDMPLFADLKSEIYLSRNYGSDDITKLQTLGLKTISIDDFLDRVEADLQKTDSKMKSPTTDNDWHTRASECLLNILNMETMPLSIHARFEKLPIIPLQTGIWTHTSSINIYFPDILGVAIPTDLFINLVLDTALTNPARRILLEKLGVKPYTPGQVNNRIRARYDRDSFESPWPPGEKSVTINDSATHIAFLSHFVTDDMSIEDGKIWLYNSKGQQIRFAGPSKVHIYFGLSSGRCDPSVILQPSGKFNFLNEIYLSATIVDMPRQGQSYLNWLRDSMGIRHSIALLNVEGSELSDEIRYIAEHNPRILVELLKHNWKEYYQQGILSNTKAKDELVRCPVPSTINGSIALFESFLPLPRLESLIQDLDIHSFGYFLRIPEEITRENSQHWKFLSELGVGIEDNTAFYLHCLEAIKREKSETIVPGDGNKLVRIYVALDDPDYGASSRGNIQYEELKARLRINTN